MLLFLLLFGMLALASAQNRASSSNSAAVFQQPLLHYTLPPDKLAKAYALYKIHYALYFVTTLWGFLVLWLMLRDPLRRLATRLGRSVVAAIAWCKPSW